MRGNRIEKVRAGDIVSSLHIGWPIYVDSVDAPDEEGYGRARFRAGPNQNVHHLGLGPGYELLKAAADVTEPVMIEVKIPITLRLVTRKDGFDTEAVTQEIQKHLGELVSQHKDGRVVVEPKDIDWHMAQDTRAWWL